MTEDSAQSCNKLHSFRMMAIKEFGFIFNKRTLFTFLVLKSKFHCGTTLKRKLVWLFL